MTNLVGRQFDLDVPGDLDFVWDALTTPEGLSSWYAVDAEMAPEPGAEMRLDWGTGMLGLGVVDEIEPPRRMRLVYEGEGGPGTEEWLLSHADGVTHLRLIHSMPVEAGATWDETYPDIVHGWALFMGTLRFIGSRVGKLGRRAEVRLGKIADGAWSRVLTALGLDATPRRGAAIDLAGRRAEVLVSFDGFSLLLAFGDEATLLIDVEGETLYTVAAGYGEGETAEIEKKLVEIAELACAAAGAGE